MDLAAAISGVLFLSARALLLPPGDAPAFFKPQDQLPQILVLDQNPSLERSKPEGHPAQGGDSERSRPAPRSNAQWKNILAGPNYPALRGMLCSFGNVFLASNSFRFLSS
jgi:hypothetical protein